MGVCVFFIWFLFATVKHCRNDGVARERPLISEPFLRAFFTFIIFSILYCVENGRSSDPSAPCPPVRVVSSGVYFAVIERLDSDNARSESVQCVSVFALRF